MARKILNPGSAPILWETFRETVNNINDNFEEIYTGYTGSAGDGYTGSQGYTGSAGYTGSRGIDGIIGVDGYTGSQGYTGSIGYTGSSGYTGSASTVIGYTGSQGYTGSKGEPGEFGGASFYYQFDTAVYASTVPEGYLLLDNVDYTQATILALNQVDRLSVDLTTFINTIDDSTSDVKGYVKITEDGNLSNYVVYAITGEHFIHNDHFHIPISYLSGDASSFDDNENIVVTFTTHGDRGDRGYTGSQGDLGYTGSIGYTGSQGIQGIEGYVGSQGYTGSQGLGIEFREDPPENTEILWLDTSDTSAVSVVGIPSGGTQYQTLTKSSNEDYDVSWTASREVLTSARTYYVSTTGNDNNDGLTLETAFLTIQNAVNVVADTIDTAGHQVTIQLAAGTYNAGATLRSCVGRVAPRIQGNELSPTEVVISTGSSSCFSSFAGATPWELRYMQLQTSSGGTTSSIIASSGSVVSINGIDFAAGNRHIAIQYGGIIEATGNYTISGAAVYHVFAIEGGVIRINSRTITITNTPAFTTFALARGNTVVSLFGNTYTGSATGTRYSATVGAVIYTAGAGSTYLPGSTAGSVATNGVYA